MVWLRWCGCGGVVAAVWLRRCGCGCDGVIRWFDCSSVIVAVVIKGGIAVIVVGDCD